MFHELQHDEKEKTTPMKAEDFENKLSMQQFIDLATPKKENEDE